MYFLRQGMNRHVCLLGEITFFRFDESTEVETSGKRMPGLKHYDVHINGKCIGVTGDSSQSIRFTPMNSSEFLSRRIVIYGAETDHEIPEKDVEEFVKKWMEDHPNYAVYDKNCQKFAKDFFKHFFGVDVMTQTNSIGFYAILIGAGNVFATFCNFFNTYSI